MTITQLRYFMVLTEELNFTNAAKKLYISQSTLSQHILKLEAELGVALFQRTPSKLTLTLEGKYLQDTAAMLLQELEALPQTLAEVGRLSQKPKEPKEFRIGVDSGAFSADPHMTAMLVAALKKLAEQHPKTDIRVRELTAMDSMFQQLMDKKLDIAVGGFRVPKSSRIASVSIPSQQMNLVIKSQPQWDRPPSFRSVMEILNTVDVYSLNFDEQHTIKTQKWLESVGYGRTLRFAESSWGLLLQLQTENIAAIVPSNRFDRGFDTQDWCIFPIEEIFIPRYISWLADSDHPMLQEFMELLTP